jgi:OmpA-OmpF porin, OOP family
MTVRLAYSSACRGHRRLVTAVISEFSRKGKNMIQPIHPHRCSLLAASAVALAFVATQAAAQVSGGYATDPAGAVVKNPYNLCWRTSSWNAAMATPECDPDLVPKPPPRVETPPPPPVAAPTPPPPPPPVAVAPPPKPIIEKVTYAADVFFDFDKAVLKPEGKARLDDLVAKLSGTSLEVIVASGHTDAVGGDAYNQKLSINRAEAVKTYLMSKGVEPNRVAAEGKGEAQPIADNKTAEGRAKNRRVELEVVGTREK